MTESPDVQEVRYTVLSGKLSMHSVELKAAELNAEDDPPRSGPYCVVFGGVDLTIEQLKAWLQACVKQVQIDALLYCNYSITINLWKEQKTY